MKIYENIKNISKSSIKIEKASFGQSEEEMVTNMCQFVDSYLEKLAVNVNYISDDLINGILSKKLTRTYEFISADIEYL